MALPLSFTQDSFGGGINLVSLGTKVQPNEYILGINVRTRFEYVDPIVEPIDTTGELPVGVKAVQGLYAFGDLLVCFIGGFAYYKNVGISDDIWHQINNFQMSGDVNRIYTQAIPAADMLYVRKNNSGSLPKAGVILDNSSAPGTSQIALVVQDGINQPWLILANGTARVSQTYDQWSLDNREYIPIGRQMTYFNGVLYVVSADGTTIYRSVSGRPADFTIAIDNNGQKVSDASITSFAVDANEIKLITALNSDSLIVITSYSAYAVTPNFDNLIYGEPTFDQTFLFSAGTINQFCWTDALGDFTFIDREGLKSFNAIKQLKFEGNNSVFSLAISKLFKGIVQDDNVCVGAFDNYVFFAVKTTQSPSSVVVYDVVKETFVSVDLLATKSIKQFATTYSASRQRIFAATVDQVLELYSPDSNTPLTATIYTREINSRNPDQEPTDGVYDIKTEGIRLIFEDGLEAGSVVVDELVNNAKESANYSRPIPAISGSFNYPLTYPVMLDIKDSLIPLDINKFKKREGQKLGYIITWTGGAKLTYFIARCSCDKGPSSIQQQSRVYNT